VVLFLSGVSGRPPGGYIITFSIASELARMILYNAPSLALLWYLMLKARSFRDWGVALPGKKDLIPAVICLPSILIIGITIAIVNSFFSEPGMEPVIFPPSSVPGWVILCISCISTGYLEESYFRFYLISRREELNLSSAGALILSTAAFSVCHIYEGPWGFLNSVLAGLVFSFLFLRYNSLHGIAIAHGLYNIIAYIVAAVF
jgi:membrane protease YdiL (CAAX protease family)